MPRFAGHESFPFRHAWLKKGYDRLLQDPEFFSRKDALVTLGVGKNMVRSIHHWLDVLGLVDQVSDGRSRGTTPVPSQLAKALLDDRGWDPYLEDDGTLWLLHYNLVTNGEGATTWHWVFNRPHAATFRRSSLFIELKAAAETYGWRASPNTLKRDIDCFVRTYLPVVSGRGSAEDAISCPLTALGLVQPTSDRDEYLLSYGWQPTLPDAIFRWGLAHFIEKVGGSTVSLSQMLRSEGSPGRVFRLGEEALVARLADLADATDGRWTYDETVGLRQLHIKERIRPWSWLEGYYRAPVPPALEVIAGGRA